MHRLLPIAAPSPKKTAPPHHFPELLSELQALGVRWVDASGPGLSRSGGAGPSDHKAVTLMHQTVMVPILNHASALSPYTAEVFPTRLRGTGSGLSAGSSKLGGLLGAIGTVTGVISVSTGMLRPALLVSIPMAIAAIAVVARGLETRGRPLEELVERQQVR